MPRHHRILVMCFALTLLGVAPGLLGAQTQAPELPDRIESNDPVEPYFVSAEAASQLKPTDPAYENVSRHLQRYLDLPESEGCTEAFFLDTGYEPAWGSPRIEEMIQQVDVIVPVTVTGSKTGFRNGGLGQLLELRFGPPLKGTVPLEVAFFFMPAGELDLFGRRYCATAYAVPDPPPVGGKALAFLYHQRIDKERSVLHLPMTHFIRLPAVGPIVPPPYLDLLGMYPSRKWPDSEKLLQEVKARVRSTTRETVAEAQAQELPDRIDTEVPVDPYFVSAEVALEMSPDDRAYVQIRDSLEYLLSLPASQECAVVQWVNTGYKPRGEEPRLQDLAHQVETIATARIEGARAGFQGNEPGQLLKLRFEETLKGTPPSETVLFFIPAGELSMFERRYCVSSRGVPNPPTVGGRMLFFLPSYGFDPERSTLGLPMTHFLTLPPRGPIQASPHLDLGDLIPGAAADSLPSSDALIAALRQLFADKERSRR